jgi:SAM-dependent methyltransferase
MNRLMFQARMLRPITARLLREAGVAPGMRVLDIGCGTGDVSVLAADLVGPSGTVVGIDRSPDVLDVARDRARSGGYDNIEFVQGDAESFDGGAPFDMAIGRYVLMHQPDPAAFIRSTASHLRRGGVVAFHEIGVFGDFPIVPPLQVWKDFWRWSTGALQSVLLHPDAGGRMRMHFEDAGLERSNVYCEVPIYAGPDSPIYAWAALTMRSLMPQAEKIGLATAAEVDIDTLEDRLRQSTLEARAQVPGARQYCGWATC